MKKILLIIALILFAGGLYVNFALEPSTHQADIMNDTETSDETAENDTEEQENVPEEDTESDESAGGEAAENDAPANVLAFDDENLDEIYNEAVENNEPLIVDVLLPGYYTDDFMDTLESEFDTDTIQFNLIGLDANTTVLSELNVNENSDAVIIDALQIRDYNDEVLPQRDVDALTTAYMNVYESDKTVFLLGNANVHEHENLAAVLDEDATYFTENDYYYIDNQDVEVDGDYYNYDDNVMTPEVEDAAAANIYDFLISE